MRVKRFVLHVDCILMCYVTLVQLNHYVCFESSHYIAFAHLCAHTLTLSIIWLTACRCTVTLMPYALYC